MRLTRLDVSAVQGERRRDTRRRVQLEELVPAGGDPAVTERLVQRLAGAEARLVVTSVDEATQRETVEVAHEALIRRWPRLQTWLDEDRANLSVARGNPSGGRGVAAARQGGKLSDPYAVHDWPPLEALSERPGFLNKNEQDYVKACVDLRKRQEKEKEEQGQRELETAKKLAEEQKARAEQETKARKAAQTKARVAIVAAVAVSGAAIFAAVQWRQTEISQIEASRDYSKAIFQSDQQLKGLKEGVSTGKKLAESTWQALLPDADLQYSVNTMMREMLREAKEHNRLSVREPVAGVAFEPDLRMIATWTGDGKAQLWKPDGTSYESALVKGHKTNFRGCLWP